VGVKVEPWKIRELEDVFCNEMWLGAMALLFLLSSAGIVYVFGPAFGIPCIVCSIVLRLVRRKRRSPLEFYLCGYGRVYAYLADDREFYDMVSDYCQPLYREIQRNLWRNTILVLLPALVGTIMSVLFPYPIGRLSLLDEIAFSAGLALLYALTAFGFDWVLLFSLKAKDPNRLSQFFGVPLEEWKIEEMVARGKLKRTPIAMGLSLLIFVSGALGLFGAILVIVDGLTRLSLPIIAEFTKRDLWRDVMPAAAGYLILGVLLIYAGKQLWWMRKTGAIMAIGFGLMPLVLGIFSIFDSIDKSIHGIPLDKGCLCGPLFLTLGVLVVLLTKKEWRKFR
jgi:hypothetical protein